MGHVSGRKMDAFIKVLYETGNVSDAADRIGIDRSSLYKERRANDAFAQDWDRVLKAGLDKLEKTAWQWATEGVEVDIYDDTGARVGSTVQRSDEMLQFLLKSRGPDKYGHIDTRVGRQGRRRVTKLEAAEIRLHHFYYKLSDDVMQDIQHHTRAVAEGYDETVPLCVRRGEVTIEQWYGLLKRRNTLAREIADAQEHSTSRMSGNPSEADYEWLREQVRRLG